MGLNVVVRVADCPGFRVSGVVIPVAPKREPETEIPEIVTGAVPMDWRMTACVAVWPMLTLPKLIVLVLRLSEGVPTSCREKLWTMPPELALMVAV